MQFRKKPVVIDATNWDGGNVEHVMDWASGLSGEAHLRFDGNVIFIQTLEGEMRCDPGDWIIRGVKGEFYPCKPDIFAQTYEPVES